MEILSSVCYNNKIGKKGGTGMNWNLIYYLLYGLVAGLSELLPVSPIAHGYLIQRLTQFPALNPVVQLFIHAAVFIAIFVRYWRRLGHIRHELKIASQPTYKRKRHPDINAVLDAKVIGIGLIPLLIAIAFSGSITSHFLKLPILCVTLILGGVIVFIPQYLPGANKDSRSLSRKDGLILGLAASLGVIPGFSRIGTMMSVGLTRGCDKNYIFDIAVLASLPALAAWMIMDIIAIALAGTVVSGMLLLYGMFAAVAAAGGAFLAIAIMRYLISKSNFHDIAYYSWGIGLFGFLAYLVI